MFIHCFSLLLLYCSFSSYGDPIYTLVVFYGYLIRDVLPPSIADSVKPGHHNQVIEGTRLITRIYLVISICC